MNRELPDAASIDCAVQDALRTWGREPTRLLQVLRRTQEPLGYLPPAALERIAAELHVPIARVRGVMAFYSFLYPESPGAYRVLFSDNVTDRMRGSEERLREMSERLWVEPGKVSEDGLVSLDRTSCTGMCDQAPALLVNGRPVTDVDAARAAQVCDLILSRTPLDAWPAELFEVKDHVRRRDVLLDDPMQPGDAIRAAIARGDASGTGPQATLDEVKNARLLGRGGAGFTTGIKWESCSRQPVTPRVVVCNADEGEPGTFKDRLLLNQYADRVFEGMAVAAYGIGASLGFVYLRGEYRYLLDALNATLDRRRRDGLLGRAICGRAGFDFDIEIHVGAGSYVCGEASAQVESLEGKRGIPRNRPPRLAEKGYLGLPTIVNNVESYCAAALIVLHGADWFRARGTSRSSGTKLLAAGARRLRRPQRDRRAGGRSLGQVHRPGRVRPAHRIRGHRDRRRLHRIRRQPRHVRDRAPLCALLRPRELRLLYAVPRRHVAAAQPDGQDQPRQGVAARPQYHRRARATAAQRESLRARGVRGPAVARHPAAVPASL